MADQPRPWMTDSELAAQQGAYGGSMHALQRPVRPPSPQATYGLLISFIAVFVLELAVLYGAGAEVFTTIFTIVGGASGYDWIYRPWSPVTATFSHSPFSFAHIFFNGIALYFFGPLVESVLGRLRFVSFFVLTGMLSSVFQAALDSDPALGASGAIMAIIGLTIVLAPRNKIILFPLPIPIPLWAGGILFALLDLLGAFSGSSGIGNFAHLSGMAMGLLYGLVIRKEMERKGLRLVTR